MWLSEDCSKGPSNSKARVLFLPFLLMHWSKLGQRFVILEEKIRKTRRSVERDHEFAISVPFGVGIITYFFIKASVKWIRFSSSCSVQPICCSAESSERS